jgi:transmembrane sensor
MSHFEPELASRLIPRWDAPRMAKNLAQISRRIRQQQRSRHLTIALAALVASVALCFLGFGLWRAQTSRPAQTAHVTPSAETRFGDGSTATALTEGAVLELQRTSDSEIWVAAKSGSYRFDIVPNPARQFVVHVADVSVRVLGTRFVVAQTNRRVEVRVERGRVEVTWPAGRSELGANESGWFPPEPQSAVPATEPAAAEPVQSSSKTPPAVSDRTRFIELSRQGNYQAAFSIIDRAPSLFEGSAEDLMMAADAARLSNHPLQAVGYLQRITKEHARDSRAPLAAFTLGRIYMNQLGQPAAAARAFALVRQLAPAGALVEDALAREAEALEQAGQHAAAQRLAADYLKQYPSGRRSEKLRELGKAAKSE